MSNVYVISMGREAAGVLVAEHSRRVRFLPGHHVFDALAERAG